MAGPPFLLRALIFLSGLFSTHSHFQPALVLDMAQILLENYCFPENLIGMQDAIQQALDSGEILRISDPKTLAALLTTGVQGALNDPRLAISYEPNSIHLRPPTRSRLSTERLMKMMRNSVKFELLEDNAGYLRMDRIMGKEAAEKISSFFLENIWSRVLSTSALVLDLRYATSGDTSGIPYLVSYFFDATQIVHIDSVYNRPTNSTQDLWTLRALPGKRYGKLKDLIILISKRTSGAAEAIAYALKHLHRAIVVGERSAGGSMNIEKLRIGDSKFYITVPVSRSINPVTGQSWEVSGVSPCVIVNAKEAVDKAKAILRIRRAIPTAIQSISRTIKQFYSFAEKVPAILHHLALTDFFSTISEEDLVAKLNYELQSVTEDPRMSVKMATDAMLEDSIEPAGKLEVPESHEGSMDQIFEVNILSGDTGYIRFDGFAEVYWLAESHPQVIRKVLDSIGGTDNLIIDLRSNMGGPSEAVPLLLSYFHDPLLLTHFYTIYSRVGNTTAEFHAAASTLGTPYGSKKGIYILTSHYTATSAEEFSYLMQSLHRATIIGEITSGTLLHSRAFPVESTDIVITIPVVNLIDNNGECWLGGGVVPDAIVLAEEALDRALEIIEFHPKVHSLVDRTGELVADHYAIIEVATKIRKVLRSKWTESLYWSVVDFESLASELTTDLHEISGDHSLHVFYSDTEPDAFEEAPEIPTAEELGHIIDDLFKTEVLPGNIGYLRYDVMADVETVTALGPQLVMHVWNKLVNTDVLIIDVRYNTVGGTSSIPLLSSYFFEADPVRHLYSLFDRSTVTTTRVTTLPQTLGRRYGPHKDIFILTSHMTGSAAEVFTRALKELGRATVIGEPTMGGSLSSRTYRIRDSPLYASVPTQVVVSAVTGKVWSVSGVEPHVTTPANDALITTEKIIRLRSKISSIVQTVGRLVVNNYAFSSIGVEVVEKLQNHVKKGQYNMTNSEVELATKLSADLMELSGDKNLKMTYVPETSKAILGPKQKQILSPEALAEHIKVSFHADVLENNIGYLRFDTFGDFEVTAKIARQLAEHVWIKIINTDALILDLRYNVGGSLKSVPGLSAFLLSANKKILLDKLYNRSSDSTVEMWAVPGLTAETYGPEKRIVILTSGVTSGAAEEFVHVLRRLGRATVVGRRTSGGALETRTFHVGGTDLHLSVPTVRPVGSQGCAWGGRGIDPHVVVPPDAALAKAEKMMLEHLASASRQQ